MVDFTASRYTASKPRGNTLFFASLCLLAVVAYAFVEPMVRKPGGDTAAVSLTDRTPN